MDINNSIKLVGNQPDPSIRVDPPQAGPASRRLMITSQLRWQIIGRLRKTSQGATAVAFAHPDDPSPLLDVDDRGAWTLRGDALVSSGRVPVQHPVVLSACVSGHPTAPNGTRARANAAEQVRLSVVGAPPAGAPSCTVIVGGVGSGGTELPSKPQLAPAGIMVAEVGATGAWVFSKRWQVLDELQPEALISVDFTSVTPEAQVLGYDGTNLAYRTIAGTTVKLAP